jgi:hemerythrin
MSIVAWKDAYSLGMPEIDDQHKVLFELINELWDAIVKRASAENQMLVIEGLEHYTIAHFTRKKPICVRSSTPSLTLINKCMISSYSASLRKKTVC